MPGVTETDSVLVGSEAAARGLDIARKLVAEKVLASGGREASVSEKALDAFVAGDAVFLRSWPYVYAALRQAGFTDQFGGSAPAGGVGCGVAARVVSVAGI